MKQPYSFTVLRYVHDIVAGEFVNVGVVLFAPTTKFLSARCTARYGRLTKMFSDINGEHFRRTTRFIQERLDDIGDKLQKELPFDQLPKSVKGFAAQILPVDDSSLQFAPEGFGITDDPQKTLEQLYHRYVEKYQEKQERHSRSDDDIWRKFKLTFEGKKVLEHLKPHKIVGKNYDYEFKHCWKNECWHAQQPISFDLVEPEDIINKALLWVGRIDNLIDGDEKFKLNILLGTPQDKQQNAIFIKAQNILHKMQCDHDFIGEDQAEDYAEKLRQEIEAHSHG